MCEVIVFPKMPTKNLKDICPGSLLESNSVWPLRQPLVIVYVRKLTVFDIVFHNSPAVLAISGPLLLGLSFLIWSRFEFIQMKKADWALLGCPSSLIFFCLLSIFSPFLKAWKSASFSAFFWAMIASAPPSSSHDLYSASYRFLSSTAFSSHS